MANPAQLLHEIFVSWNHADKSAQKARGVNGTNWDTHTRAVRFLDEIAEILRLLESHGRNMRVARETMPTWYQTVFVFNYGWSGANTGAIDQRALDNLEQLAERLQDVVPEVAAGGIEQINQYIDLVRKTVLADTSLPTELRSHINDVVDHVRWCTDNYAIAGDFSLQDAVERLSGAIVRGYATSGEKSKWKDVLDKFVWPFTVNVVSALPSATLAALAVAG